MQYKKSPPITNKTSSLYGNFREITFIEIYVYKDSEFKLPKKKKSRIFSGA